MVENFRWTMSISNGSNPNTMSYLPYSFLKDAYTKLGMSKLYSFLIFGVIQMKVFLYVFLTKYSLFYIILSGLTFIFRKLLDSTRFQGGRGIA